MKLICPNCKTEHDSTYLHPSMKELICKICDTEFPIDNTGWEESLPVKYRPPANSEIQMYWETDNFLEVVLPPQKLHWFWTSLKVLAGLVGGYYVFFFIKIIGSAFGQSPIWWFAWILISFIIFAGLKQLYKNLIPYTEYQKIRINKDEVIVDKVNLFHKTSKVLKSESAGIRKSEDKEKGTVLELVDYKEATQILERLNEEEQEWSKEMLTKILEEVKLKG